MIDNKNFSPELLDAIWQNQTTAIMLLDKKFKVVYANTSTSETTWTW